MSHEIKLIDINVRNVDSNGKRAIAIGSKGKKDVSIYYIHIWANEPISLILTLTYRNENNGSVVESICYSSTIVQEVILF